MGSVNIASIREKIKKISRVQKEINSKVFSQFEQVKNKTIEEFEAHPVTKELKQGPETNNISNTLNGIGNLYSYIGFNQGENPTENVKSILSNEMKISPVQNSIMGNKYKASYKISYPSESDIAQKTPLPWEPGRSWVSGIERGISGFGFYITKIFLKGRSKTALQSQKEVRSGSFKPTTYWSDIINNFFKNVNNIKIK